MTLGKHIFNYEQLVSFITKIPALLECTFIFCSLLLSGFSPYVPRPLASLLSMTCTHVCSAFAFSWQQAQLCDVLHTLVKGKWLHGLWWHECCWIPFSFYILPFSAHFPLRSLGSFSWRQLLNPPISTWAFPSCSISICCFQAFLFLASPQGLILWE